MDVIAPNSDLSSCLKFAQASCLTLWERCHEVTERVKMAVRTRKWCIFPSQSRWDSSPQGESQEPGGTSRLLAKLEFDRILDDKKQSCDEVLPGGAPGRTVLIRGEGIRNHRFSIGSTSVPPRVASLVTFLSTQESNAPRRGADDRHPQHGA